MIFLSPSLGHIVCVHWLFLGYNQSYAHFEDDSLWSFSKIRTDLNGDNTLDYLGHKAESFGNGPGPPNNFNWDMDDSLGTMIIRTFALQL